MRNLYEMLAQNRQRFAELPAVFYKGARVNYRELLGRVDAASAAFWDCGVRGGDRVGFLMKNSPDFITAYFALARIGAVVVPMNFQLTPPEISYILNDCKAGGLLADPEFFSHAIAVRAMVPSLKLMWFTGRPPSDSATPGERISSGILPEMIRRGRLAASPPASPPGPDSLAVIIYTSGTTGKPKGAMLSHGNLISNAESSYAAVDAAVGLAARDRLICLLPMFHSFAWTTCVLVPFVRGMATVVIDSIQPFGNVLKQVIFRKVTVFVGIPPLFSALAAKLRIPFFLRWLNPVRVCISGAAALPPKVLEKFEQKIRVPLLEGYGLTEASPVVSLNPMERRVPGSIGKPVPGVQVRIADAAGVTLPAGEIGEVAVRGLNVMQGYWNLPRDTAIALRDGWLFTGDLGRMDADGYIYIVDRKKDMIIVKGMNVYPREVEEVLEDHPSVQDAAVIGEKEPTGDELVKAYVILKDGALADKSQLLAFCRQRLAAYKVPRSIEFARELQRNILGKVSKKALREAHSNITEAGKS